MSKTLVEMTAEIIQSQISGSNMSTEEIKAALHDTYQTLKGLQEAEAVGGGGGVEEKDAVPSVDPKRSIRKNEIVCLECGQAFKMLTKHLKSHNMNAREYRKKYGFTSRQSLCAKALSDERSAASKERGIHPNLRKSIAERAGKKKKSA
ncbi:MucR family transcriptional regulator [Desulfobulbus sp. F4]|nr:MucR family transcriptional regulator [Desulfobulbus sp. F3]MCW5200738.1 MucR family transcriptional regulator [Desulfobulbus sp. F4]